MCVWWFHMLAVQMVCLTPFLCISVCTEGAGEPQQLGRLQESRRLHRTTVSGDRHGRSSVWPSPGGSVEIPGASTAAGPPPPHSPHSGLGCASSHSKCTPFWDWWLLWTAGRGSTPAGLLPHWRPWEREVWQRGRLLSQDCRGQPVFWKDLPPVYWVSRGPWSSLLSLHHTAAQSSCHSSDMYKAALLSRPVCHRDLLSSGVKLGTRAWRWVWRRQRETKWTSREWRSVFRVPSCPLGIRPAARGGHTGKIQKHSTQYFHRLHRVSVQVDISNNLEVVEDSAIFL